MNFTHLHVHTEYSLLDGSNKISEYVSRVKELGMDSAAITDHGAMYGVIDFYRAAKAAGINPVLGCEVYVAPGSRFDREAGTGDDRYYHLVLLAENNQGYSNLMKIVSKGFVEGFYYKPRVDLELLGQYHEGLIALSACLAGEVARFITRGMYEEAKAAALRYQDIFGKGNFFLELQDHGISDQETVNSQLLRMSRETGIELVCTNDVHYTYAEDAEPHDVLLCLQTGKKLADEDRMRYDGGQYYVKSPEEMAALFSYAPQALENTYKIAHRCHVEIEFGVTKLPKFDVPEPYTSWEYLNRLCFEGLEKRYSPVKEELKERLTYELSTIKNMGYVDYFLIVWDFIRYARENDIMVGPGRGSAAGSLVAYTLGITQLDPIKYDLLFERFLNPERVSMPDIDVDFCFERRQEVIDYVVRKYGKDRVVQIVTFGTMAARGVIRDVGRVLDMPYAQVDAIAKLVPRELNITLDKALKMNPELRKAYEEQEEIHRLIDLAKRLEGLPRHTSMHAAGVVISQKSVDEYVPLSRASDGTITTQFTMTTLEELGLLKMDFLGLRTLTVIQNAVRLVEKDTGHVVDLDHLDYDDKKVLESLGSGHAEGVFQLESAGMRSFMKELKPQSLEDIIAGISLYRPGPMDFIPQYIRGKNRPDTIRYDCPQLEPILKATYGCIVYQEQVMQIVQKLAGYTLGRSDLVRRAMSKKKASVMEKERQNFVYGNEAEGVPGCIANGIPEKTANKIFDEMTDFAKYAFNKSHAAAYAVVCYQTAYLKYYYPVEFMAALMTSVIEMPTKVAEYISVCRQMGIQILPPDINVGEYGFSVDEGAIRYGLSAIKSVGRPVIEAIVREREENGKYRSLKDFIERNTAQVNKRAIENFIKAGALDCLEGNRRQKMMVYASIAENIAQERKHGMAGQLSLFDIVDDSVRQEFEVRMPAMEEYDKETLLSYEKEVLGIYLSGHPLEKYSEMMEKTITAKTTDFQPDEETGLPAVRDSQKVILGGMITERTVKYTKKNQIMAFLTLEDLVGTVEVMVFPQSYEKWQKEIGEEAKVFIQGRVSLEEDKASKLILEKVRPFKDVPRELWFQFSGREEYGQREQELFSDLRESPGKNTVVIFLKDMRAMKKLPPAFQVDMEDTWLSRMRVKYGQDNVKVVERVLKNL
ncbi:MAG: DNA polymerase III subunit alpha [Clostridiales bacterium]|nr:DNA polymerase III subunit alpha [Clostridiales bacterium]